MYDAAWFARAPLFLLFSHFVTAFVDGGRLFSEIPSGKDLLCDMIDGAIFCVS